MVAPWSHSACRVTAAIAIFCASSTAGLAASKCKCVAKGKRVDLGTVVCLEVTSSQRYLARCERVLNNTSWKKIEDDCPTA